MTERLWVQIPTDAGHFSLLYPISSATLIQVPHGGATLLIFLSKICLSAQLEAKRAQYPWIEKKTVFSSFTVSLALDADVRPVQDQRPRSDHDEEM